MRFIAVLNSANASTPAALTFYRPGGVNKTIAIAATDQIQVDSVFLSHPTGDAHVFFSTEGTATGGWRTLVRGNSASRIVDKHYKQPRIGPAGYTIYASCPTGQIDVIIEGEILRKS